MVVDDSMLTEFYYSSSSNSDHLAARVSSSSLPTLVRAFLLNFYQRKKLDAY